MAVKYLVATMRAGWDVQQQTRWTANRGVRGVLPSLKSSGVGYALTVGRIGSLGGEPTAMEA